jgi:AraC family transcriptional activator of tynA and feaB
VQLQDFSSRTPELHCQAPLGEWTERLQAACGRFNPQPHEGEEVVTGGVLHSCGAGVDFVQVATDVHLVQRERCDISRDFGEHFFLLMQLEGSCAIEQHDRQSVISPGDCILVDSAAPSKFYFNGRFSNHVSVHLPRQLMLADKSEHFEVSRRLSADDPMSTMLRALVAKLMRTEASDHRAPHLRQLLLQATRQAFAAEGDEQTVARREPTGGRIEIAQMLVDRHLTEECLSPQWLARRLGVSMRTLQEDFNSLGVTVTSFIRDRRLRLARDRLVEMKLGAGCVTIAEVAYASGFNDISYFNRCFKKAFDCSPKDVGRN